MTADGGEEKTSQPAVQLPLATSSPSGYVPGELSPTEVARRAREAMQKRQVETPTSRASGACTLRHGPEVRGANGGGTIWRHEPTGAPKRSLGSGGDGWKWLEYA